MDMIRRLTWTTGAGTNDVTLQGIVDASVGFLNASYQQFDYGTSFPWGMDVGDDTNYAGTPPFTFSVNVYQKPIVANVALTKGGNLHTSMSAMAVMASTLLARDCSGMWRMEGSMGGWVRTLSSRNGILC